MINALIIDDSKRDRERLLALLSKHDDVNIIQQCESAEEGLEAIAKHNPQLIFLDVEMPPGISGLEMLEKIEQRNFLVIFTTSYSDLAIKAIEIVAYIHYLVKPAEQQKLDEALDRFRRNKNGNDATAEQLNALLDHSRNWGNKKNKIAFPSQKEPEAPMFSADSIVYCKADGPYTEVYFADKGMILSSKPLAYYETKLFPHGFKKIHRSYIVNTDHIIKVSRNKDYFIVKHFPQAKQTNTRDKDRMLTEIPISDTHRKDFDELF